MNGGADGLTQWPGGEGEPEAKDEDDPEETIEACLQEILEKQESDRKMRERLIKLIVRLRLAEEHKGKWKEIDKFLGNLKWPEGQTSNTMQQFRQEVTKFLVSDGVLYRRWKPTEPPANVLVSMEKRRKAMEAVHGMIRHCRREGALQYVVHWFWWPEMYINIKDWVRTCKKCENRALLRYDEPLKSLNVSHL